MEVLRFVLWKNHQREWFKVQIIGSFNFIVLLTTTKQISKKNGVKESRPFGRLLGKGVQLYIDGKFNIVPDSFDQCLIIMAFEETLRVYVPVMYILMNVKTHCIYWHAVHWVIVATKCSLHPFSVTCNFEKPLYNAVREQFKHVILNGCLFHWKQAIWRKMKAKNIRIRYEKFWGAMPW